MQDKDNRPVSIFTCGAAGSAVLQHPAWNGHTKAIQALLVSGG